jgi:hypothetical protein
MSTPKERFELFLSYMRDRTSLTPEQIHDIEQRLENCEAIITHYKPEDADRISNSKIFKDGQIKASVSKVPRPGGSPAFKLLTVGNLECFLTFILIDMKDLTANWIANLPNEITDEFKDHFAQLVVKWAFVRRRLIDLALIRKDRNVIGKELKNLQVTVLSKIPNHKFPEKSIEFLEELKNDNVIDHLIYLFQNNIPELGDQPTAYRISELLKAFGISAKPGTIRQRIIRSKKAPPK